MKQKISRRDMLKLMAMSAGGIVLASCTTATAVPTTAATTAPTVANTLAPTAPPAHMGAWLDSTVFTAISDQPSAIAQLQAGAINVYQYTSNNPDLFKTVKGDAKLTYSNSYGSFDQFIFNTKDYSADGTLNPFSDAQIREAMNWAVDRNYLAQELTGGLAVPRFTAVGGSSSDAARYAGILGAIATKYAYNMDKATQVIGDRMTALGATKDSSGKWQFQGKPVTIIGLTRIEDQRKQYGEYLANQLTTLGFTMNNLEKKSSEASPIWTGSLDTYTFGFYTAGWINNYVSRDEGQGVGYMGSNLAYPYPVFQVMNPSAALLTADKALYTNDFSTMAERDQLFQTALTGNMTEGWWGLFLVDLISFTPFQATVGTAADLASGLNTHLLPLTLRFNGKEGGTLQMAQPTVFNDPWNPMLGSNWVYDATPQIMTEDVAVFTDPYTGLITPTSKIAKVDLIVKTGLPVSKNLDWVNLTTADSIAVPDDAWADWDAKAQTFISAKDRAAADTTYKQTTNTQVTVTYAPDIFNAKWHDGSNLSVADFVMAMIQIFDSGKKDSPIYADSNAATVEAYLSHFKGVKIVSTSPLTITTWDDAFTLDAENNVATWYPSTGLGQPYPYGTASWYSIAPAIQAETDGKMSFDQTKAGDNKVDWTSMLAGPTLAIQDTYLQQDVTSGYVPYAPTLGTYVTADQAKAAYTSLEAFYKAHGATWVGTGPYFLDKIDSTAVSITVSKFAGYLYADDQFTTAYSEPMIAVAAVSADSPTTIAAGSDAKFTVDVSFNKQPYPSAKIAKVSYTLFGSDGSQVATGDATMSAEGQYIVDLTADITGKLAAGSATLSVAIASNVVALPTFVNYQFVVTK